MAGDQLPVLTIDIDESKIAALNEISEKFKAAFSIGPGGFSFNNVPQPGQPVKKDSAQADEGKGLRPRDEKGRFLPANNSALTDKYRPQQNKPNLSDDVDKFLKNTGKTARGTLKTFRLINKTLRVTGVVLKKLFTTTVTWGARLAAISGGGLFGYGFLAHRATEQYKSAQGLGITTGEMQAANNVYGSRFSNTGNLLQALAAAQNNPGDPRYAGLVSLGINPRDGAAVNLPKLLEGVSGLLKQYKGTGVSQAVLKGYGLDGVIDVATANQVLANSDRLPQLNKQFQEQARRLDRDLGSGTQQSHQDLSARFMDNASRISNTFLKTLARLNGPISRLSDNLTASIEKFLNGRNGQALFDTLAHGLEKLGNWLGSDDFQTDLMTFSDCVKQIILVIGNAISWIAGTSGDANLNGAGTGPEGANPAYVAFGNKYLGGRLPGANPLTNQYTGDIFKEEDVASKYQMPDALKTNVQTFVEAVNKTANLPNGLMSAIAQKESSWNPLARNKSGAAGLFQLMPDTAKAYGLEGDDVYDPNKSAVAAARYLNDLRKRYRGDLAKMLTSYNGGRIDKDGNLSLKKETVDYLLEILPKVQGGLEQHPGIKQQLETASRNLAKGGKDDRATIDLRISSMPGSDISAQVKGIYVTPR
ncbi:lytic transglycosylase domain-containing protein [Salmonella enterica]